MDLFDGKQMLHKRHNIDIRHACKIKISLDLLRVLKMNEYNRSVEYIIKKIRTELLWLWQAHE